MLINCFGIDCWPRNEIRIGETELKLQFYAGRFVLIIIEIVHLYIYHLQNGRYMVFKVMYIHNF